MDGEAKCSKCGSPLDGEPKETIHYREGLCGPCWVAKMVGGLPAARAAKEAGDTIRFQFHRDDTTTNAVIDQQIMAAVKACVTRLAGEGYDCQVFATRVDPATGETVTQVSGRGNVFARLGMVSAWLRDNGLVEV